MTGKQYKSAIEAILFAAGDSVDIFRLSQVLELSESKIKSLLDELIDEYAKLNRGITIIKLNKSYQMVSVKEYAQFVRKAMDLRRNIPLSQAAMEVLSVVAYNQPVTKAFIEQVRGVDCSGVISSLTTKDLIEEKGRLELPGRPLLYGTTENFLRCFSISSIDELPEIESKQKEDPKSKDEQLSIFEDKQLVNDDNNQDLSINTPANSNSDINDDLKEDKEVDYKADQR